MARPCVSDAALVAGSADPPVPVIEVLASGPAEGGGIGRFMRYIERANAKAHALDIIASIDPRGPGHWISTAWRLPASLLHLVGLRLRHGARPIVHVHIAGRLSTLRKCAVIACAQWLGMRVVPHYHEYGYAAFLASLKPIWRELVIKCLAGCDRHIVLGRNEATRLPAALGIPADRFTVVHTCAPVELLDAPRQTNSELIEIVFLGALSDRKGVDDLLRAAAAANAALVQQGLSRPWRMSFCGGGDIAARRARAADLGIGDRCSFRGHVDETTVRAQLSASDIFVLPSHAEGLSVALLEAMALGCAVIATPVGEQDSVLRHQQNALVVTPGDVDGLAAALLELITNENLRHALGAIARADIRNGMTSDVSLARIAAALRQAAQR